MDQNLTLPLVSVNIATYNRGKYITEAIDSVLSQSFKNWELIIVDDGSTDGTENIVSPYLNDPRIKYFKNESNRNISYTRNRALLESKGRFIAILDSDDKWPDPDKLTKQVYFLDKHPDYGLIGTALIVINSQGEKLNEEKKPSTDERIKQQILFKNPITHSSVLYIRELVISLGSYDLNLNGIEDYDLWLRLGQVSKLSNLSDYSTAYRKHDNNISLTNRLKLMAINIDLVKKYQTNYPHYHLALFRRKIRYLIFKLLNSLTKN